jgi:hypothetical protein
VDCALADLYCSLQLAETGRVAELARASLYGGNHFFFAHGVLQ